MLLNHVNSLDINVVHALENDDVLYINPYQLKSHGKS